MSGTAKAERIAVLLHSLAAGGGAQRRVVELVNGFVAAGRTVDLFVVSEDGGLRDLLPPEVRVVLLQASVETLREHLERDPPDALLAGAAAIHALAVSALPQPRSYPLILRASSHPFRNLPSSMPWERLREAVRRPGRVRRYAAADLIIAVSADVADAIRLALPSARIMVSQDPVVTERFLAGADAPVRLPWPGDAQVPLILGVGRLALAKDFPTLVRAFALLRKDRPARLAILGGGSPRQREVLLRLARKLGVEADFALPGETDAIAGWLKRAALFVSSSLWEGAPGALIEALAMGCPAVATSSVGSAADLLRNGEIGAIVPSGHPGAMAVAMAAQLDNPPPRSRLIAAAEPYRANAQADDYLAAIDECLREFRSRRARSRETS